MPTRLLTLIISLGMPAFGAAQTITRGPFLQKLGPDTITVVFETDVATDGRVQYGSGDSLELTATGSSATHHEITLTALEPSSTYSYRAGAGATQSAQAQFATAPDRDEPFRFVVYGDTRPDGDDHGLHQEVADAVAAELPDFVVHTGDLVENGSMDSDWDTFFQIEAALLRETPFFPLFGNHEQWDLEAAKYKALFALPSQPDGSEQTWYSFDYGNSRFIVLNTHDTLFGTEMSAAQLAWAEQTIAQAAAEPRVAHLFVFAHHGPYSSSKHGGAANIRDWLEGLPERDRIQLVFSGHDHNYERWEAASGLRGFVCGGGGAPLYSQDLEDEPYTRHFYKGNHHLTVEVAGDWVRVCPKAPDGAAIEACMEIGRPPISCQTQADCPSEAGGDCDGEWECTKQICSWYCTVEMDDPPGCDCASAQVSRSSGLFLLAFLLLVIRRRR